MDVFDFGTLCHLALEAMAREPSLRNCQDASDLRQFLVSRLDQDVRRKYGDELTLPLLVQVEAARQRLSRAAEIQAATRAEGWVLMEAETPFEIDVGGVQVVGKIDRIDRHEVSGDWRVVDYKTSDLAVDPEAAHWRGVRRNDENAPEFARFFWNGRELVWKDLQLPLYRQAVRARAAGANLYSGYFNLPKATSAGSLRIWNDYTRELDEAAWRCSVGVTDSIRAGIFWPPNERLRPDTDIFAPLFHHGVADSIEWADARVSTGSTGPKSEVEQAP
jgi:ATP-dependent helicase/nuclease subunit B